MVNKRRRFSMSTEKNHLCPFHKNPSDDCFFNKMNSQDLDRAASFCIENYETCTIYQKRNIKASSMKDHIRQ